MWRVVVLAALPGGGVVCTRRALARTAATLIFSSPHQEYVAGNSGGAETSLARDWIAASTGALAQPTRVALPYDG
jgi:hypothetical protein